MKREFLDYLDELNWKNRFKWELQDVKLSIQKLMQQCY